MCIIAYGQTGAGKTYTMMGPRNAPGVNIRYTVQFILCKVDSHHKNLYRSMKELFKICRERKKIKYTMKVEALLGMRTSMFSKFHVNYVCACMIVYVFVP